MSRQADTRAKVVQMIASLVLSAFSVEFFLTGRWVAGLVLAAIVILPAAYRHIVPLARARRQSGQPTVVDFNPLLVAVVLTAIGLALLFRVVTAWPPPNPVSMIAAIVVVAGCLTIAFRLFTFVRLERSLRKAFGGSPVFVGTGESPCSRLRAISLEQQKLVVVVASPLGRPQTFGRRPLHEISSVDEPEIGSVRVRNQDGFVFCVQRGFPKAAGKLMEELAVRRTDES